MPFGIQRLNVKKTQPNPNIVFIKPLKGADEAIAQDFLERIAAQCLPVMREHHLYVMSLEEYEPNREFVGRNFNAGEVVQLVLKSPRTGRWLPFDYVQMVMMHELAHCKQMNHSRAFWAVRNQYASQMQGLWSKGYTGDGIWGRGINLATAEWEKNTVRADDVLPEHLCGGTYRSRGRKRKAKPTLTYKERKEKRILKKFGKNGVALGMDEEAKVKLEKGKRIQAKPRVAGSARGRELRAAAALARFEQHKSEPPSVKDESETESGSESEDEDGRLEDADSKDALDVDGSRLLDSKGRGMIKVCEDEALEDPAARNELDELRNLMRTGRPQERQVEASQSNMEETQRHDKIVKQEAEARDADLASVPAMVKREPQDDLFELDVLPSKSDGTSVSKSATIQESQMATSKAATERPECQPSHSEAPRSILPTTRQKTLDSGLAVCSVCSYANPQLSVTCAMCVNVLNPTTTTNSWRCTKESCRSSPYMNSGDCGVCGLCGQKRS
ncbi:DNA-dependent metalloprotease WSS1 [Paramyrothecium foliicola]|nr:DNA-dependent metalloprotease WSS1 [Paramyrothecium foliicola]